ncbi:ATP synthase subunit b', chloroplastic [Fagus crenata]
MFALDKIYFTPVGKFMDDRDAEIRAKLNDVKDTSGEVKQLEEQGAAILKAARAEISAALNKMKKETQAEVEEKLAEGRKKVEAELQEALANLEQQKEETMKALDSQIATLSQEIVKKEEPVSAQKPQPPTPTVPLQATANHDLLTAQPRLQTTTSSPPYPLTNNPRNLNPKNTTLSPPQARSATIGDVHRQGV